MRLSALCSPSIVWLSFAAAVPLVSACSSDLPAATGSTDSGDATGTGTDTGDVEPFEPIPARGNIALTTVVANQGVDVTISVDGVWVGPADRNTFVVSDRDTLLRGFWEIPEDWSPRPITARLDLTYADGTSLRLEDTKMIEGPSFAGDLGRGFVFPLVDSQFPAGVAYHMTLWEAEPGAEDLPESSTVIESPIGGAQLIGAQPEPVELKVVMIPVVYNNGKGCVTDTSVEVTEEQEMTFINYLHEQYPIRELIWDFRRDEPFVIDFELSSLAQLWEPLQELRVADNADPNYYYYALINVCGGGIDDAAGIAPGLATDTKDAAYLRVSSGVWLEGQPYAYHTMVHELGHNHGRAHVFCAGGDAAGTDPSYPHNDGQIGVWGFGIRNFKLHSPTATRDIMTYCDPSWVSDWGWSKAFNRIRTLTAWDYAGAPADPGPQGEVLMGLILKDGTEQWWTTPGGNAPEFYSSGEVVSFNYGDTVIDAPVNVTALDDGNTMVVAPVPRPFVELQEITRVDGGQTRALELMGRHRPQAVTAK